MKNLLLALLLVSTSSFAALDKGVREATLKANQTFDLATLDRVGSIVENKKTGEILYNHCVKRDKTNECKEIIHILSQKDKDLILHNRKNKAIVQDVEFIKYRLEMSFRESTLNFSDFDPVYRRSVGDFTSYIATNCTFDDKNCALMILLPVSIAADILMLPIDITINETQRLIIRRKAKLYIKDLEGHGEIIKLNHLAFLSMLKGLSQF